MSWEVFYLNFFFNFIYFVVGPEYGTIEAAWKGILTEADRLSDVHLKVKDNLCSDVMTQIKTWQKENYHKVSRKFFLIFLYCFCLTEEK